MDGKLGLSPMKSKTMGANSKNWGKFGNNYNGNTRDDDYYRKELIDETGPIRVLRVKKDSMNLVNTEETQSPGLKKFGMTAKEVFNQSFKQKYIKN